MRRVMSSIRPAFLRQTTQDKSLIFASVAEASLDNLIYAVWRRAANALSSRSVYGRFFSRWFHEIYFIGHFFLQMSNLNKFGATFSEHFFGLKRTSLKNVGSPQLSKKEVLLGLIFTSVAHYAMKKLDQANEYASNGSLMKLNALVNAGNCVASTVQYIRFLSGKSDVVTLSHLLSGVKLEYSNEMASQTGNTLGDFIFQALQNGLGLSAFFLQFSQWWQTEGRAIGNAVTVPPPPAREERDVGVGCALCNFEKRDLTLLSVSGHTFCYKCISDFVEKFKKCPITNIPADVSKLIKLQE